jgi:hypothetical protein
MKVNLGGEIEFECFQIEDARNAEKLAQETDGLVYSWKTEGRFNWLKQGLSIVNVLGMTVLPAGLPDKIDLPDDGEILF